MQIGFYFEASIRSGGAYQYALNLLDALKENKEHSYTVFNVSPDFPFSEFNLPNWKIINLIPKKEAAGGGMLVPHKPTLRRSANLLILDLLRKLNLYRLEIFLTKLKSKKRAKKFIGHGIDLMFFHGPSELSFLTPIPSVVPIHDLQHRINPQFPEVSQKGQRTKREYLYGNIKKDAYKILVDSPIGKEDVISLYPVNPEKIDIIPFLPPTYLNPDITAETLEQVKQKYNLPDKFLFYPAQFWPHKNHQNLVKATKILKDKGINVPLVFVGTDQKIWSELEKIKKLIKDNGLENQVYFLGYVNNEEISALYKLAIALIMPTFFGPTNIPVIEAWQMGCPVLCSDIRGCREQAGDAALLFNPSDPEDIAQRMELIWNNEQLQNDLVAKGKERLKSWTKSDFYRKINEIINEFAETKRRHYEE